MSRAKPKARDGEGINRRTSLYVNRGHVYFRRSRAHDGMRQIVDGRVQSGRYRHVRNEDDVEVYRIVKTERALQDVADVTLENAIVVAACSRDWQTYKAATEEFKQRYLGSGLPIGTAMMSLNTTLIYLHDRITRRGGPGEAEIKRELAALSKHGRIITGTAKRRRAH